MKTNLPERSLIIKDRLDAVVKEILITGKNKIAMIILFGSYARGDWVRDVYQEGHNTYSYQSDFDLLIVLNSGRYFGRSSNNNLQHDIEKRLELKFPEKNLIQQHPSVTLVIEPIKKVNEWVEKGQYFFSDIIREGILLYDSKEFKLSQVNEAKLLPWLHRKEIAKQDYQQWFTTAVEFFETCQYCLKQGKHSLSAFLLHQATESFYNCILLVFTGYKPKLHDLLILGEQAREYNHELITIFPCATQEHKQCFTLLRNAYIEARYDRNYKVTKEQLDYLINRVEKLKILTEEICQQWINQKVL